MAIVGRTYRKNDKSKIQAVLIGERNGGREYELRSAINNRCIIVRACSIYDRLAAGGWSIVPESEYASARTRKEKLQAA